MDHIHGEHRLTQLRRGGGQGVLDEGMRTRAWLLMQACRHHSPMLPAAAQNVFGQQSALKWWHGKGGLLDYSNPEAVLWWHAQLDNVLSLGVDGWKCDGTDPFLGMYLLPVGRKGAPAARAAWRAHP